MTSALALTLAVLAPEAAPRWTELQVVGASLFKNGYAVVLREAPLQPGGVLYLKEPPTASLGTLWISATPGVRIQEVVSLTIPESVERPANSVSEVLGANLGKTVRLILNDGRTEIFGTLSSVGQQSVVVDTASGRVVLDRGHVLRVESPGRELVTTIGHTQQVRALRVRATGPRDGKVVVSTLQRGLTWSPSYVVDISDPESLRLNARSTILNDLDPLKNVEVRLVTGFPHIEHLGRADPLTSGMSVEQYLQMMMSAGVMAAPGAMTQNVMRREALAAPMEFGAFEPPSLPGVQAEDLFFYRLPGVNLLPGERGSYMLFESRSPFRHLYTLDIQAVQDPRIRVGMGGFGMQGGDQEGLQDVWHTLVFSNQAGQPLTTAPVLVTKDGLTLGQDTMHYVSAGAEATVRVTKALDIRAESIDEERERRTVTVPFGTGQRTLHEVTVEGRITVHNRKERAVTMRVTRRLSGEVLSVDQGGRSTRTMHGLRDINPESTVVWEPTIDPGKTLEMRVVYKTLIPVG